MFDLFLFLAVGMDMIKLQYIFNSPWAGQGRPCHRSAPAFPARHPPPQAPPARFAPPPTHARDFILKHPPSLRCCLPQPPATAPAPGVRGLESPVRVLGHPAVVPGEQPRALCDGDQRGATRAASKVKGIPSFGGGGSPAAGLMATPSFFYLVSNPSPM